MRGVITGRDVLIHSWTILHEFGLGAYGRCLGALFTGRPSTFLEAVQGVSLPASRRSRRVGQAIVCGLAVTALTLAVHEDPAAERRCDACVAPARSCA